MSEKMCILVPKKEDFRTIAKVAEAPLTLDNH